MAGLKLLIIPITIVILIVTGSSYYATTDGIKDTITQKIGNIQADVNEKISKIGIQLNQGKNDLRNLFGIDYAYLVDVDELYFEINEEEFNIVKDGIDNAINIEEGGYEDVVIKKMLLTYYSSLCTVDTKIFITITPEEIKYFEEVDDVFKLYKKDPEDEKYKEIKKSNVKDNDTDIYISADGIVQIASFYSEKKSENPEEHEMAYLPNDGENSAMQLLLKDARNGQENAIEGLKKAYTINDIGKIVMYRAAVTRNNEGNITKVSTEEVELDYRPHISKYVIPVEFLANLLDITGSTDFIDKFSLLQYNSTVKIGVFTSEMVTNVAEGGEGTENKTADVKTTVEGIETSTSGGADLTALKQKFPHGSYWGGTTGSGYGNNGTSEDVDTVRDYSRCSDWSFSGCVSPSFEGCRQCDGWAKKVAYDYYGTSPNTWKKSTDKSSIKAGDVIRFGGSVGHTVWVTDVDSEGITIAECNFDEYCKITWGRKIYFNNFVSSNYSYGYHYVAPYALGSGGTATTQTSTSSEDNENGQLVQYTETVPVVYTEGKTTVNDKYQIELLQADTWYINVNRSIVVSEEYTYKVEDKDGNDITTSGDTTYGKGTFSKLEEENSTADNTATSTVDNTSNNNIEDTSNSSSSSTTKTIKDNENSKKISKLKGTEKDIVDRVITNSKKTNCQWETALLEEKEISEYRKVTTVKRTTYTGNSQVEDKTDRFLALLKNTKRRI